MQALTAWTCGDPDALATVLRETAADQPDGTPGVLFALLAYARWLAQNTGPLHEQGADPEA